MKYMLVLLFSASLVNPTKGETSIYCDNLCGATLESLLKTAGTPEPTVCRAAQIALDCYKSCGAGGSAAVGETNLKSLGYTCHLSGSRTLSASHLTVLSALLLTTYGALIQ